MCPLAITNSPTAAIRRGHWTKRRGATFDLDTASGGRHSVVFSWSPRPPRPPKPASPDGLTPNPQTIEDIVDAGGMLERGVPDDDTNYQSLVGMINRHKMARTGQALIMITGMTYHHRLFRLGDGVGLEDCTA
jgi:hypothetical protein